MRVTIAITKLGTDRGPESSVCPHGVSDDPSKVLKISVPGNARISVSPMAGAQCYIALDGSQETRVQRGTELSFFTRDEGTLSVRSAWLSREDAPRRVHFTDGRGTYWLIAPRRGGDRKPWQMAAIERQRRARGAWREGVDGADED